LPYLVSDSCHFDPRTAQSGGTTLFLTSLLNLLASAQGFPPLPSPRVLWSCDRKLLKPLVLRSRRGVSGTSLSVASPITRITTEVSPGPPSSFRGFPGLFAVTGKDVLNLFTRLTSPTLTSLLLRNATSPALLIFFPGSLDTAGVDFLPFFLFYPDYR